MSRRIDEDEDRELRILLIAKYGGDLPYSKMSEEDIKLVSFDGNSLSQKDEYNQ